MIEGAAAPLTGTALETPRVLELQRAFWMPLLEAARAHDGLRSDRSLEDIMEWLIFVQFFFATAGIAIGMPREQMRDWINAYIVAGLHE